MRTRKIEALPMAHWSRRRTRPVLRRRSFGWDTDESRIVAFVGLAALITENRSILYGYSTSLRL